MVGRDKKKRGSNSAKVTSGTVPIDNLAGIHWYAFLGRRRVVGIDPTQRQWRIQALGCLLCETLRKSLLRLCSLICKMSVMTHLKAWLWSMRPKWNDWHMWASGNHWLIFIMLWKTWKKEVCYPIEGSLNTVLRSLKSRIQEWKWLEPQKFSSLHKKCTLILR